MRPTAYPPPSAVHRPTAALALGDEADRARRFRDTALPHLDDVYTVARYMMRSAADADDAVQECYLRAFRHFDGFRGEAIKPWLLAILRNVCQAEFARRAGRVVVGGDADVADDAAPLWHEEADNAESELLRREDAERLRGLVAALPDPFREVIVLRDIEDLSYRDIARVTGAPIGTVMSRIARARGMLREAWLKPEDDPESREPHEEKCK